MILSHEIGYQVSHLIFRRFEPGSTLSHMTLLIVIPAILSTLISNLVRSPYIALLIAFVAYWSGLVYFTLAYRLSQFHPLAKYPGPVLAKSSKFWAAYHSAIGDQHRCYMRLHDRYGDVVRIGSPLTPTSSVCLTRFQVPMNSPFATLPSSIQYLAWVASPKANVRTGRLFY